MNKVSPVIQRIMLNLVDECVAGGIGFVPMPYKDNAEQQELLHTAIEKLEEIAVLTEEEEQNAER